ncbi:hypothetical protein PENSPDRAFT_667027 [Peniophora sp. CONT]|nr:hypothetical protein PENSPDRAFT_667027 [Peniophora sp. CONT]
MSFRVNVQKSCSRLFYLVEGDPRLRLGIEKMVCHTTLQSSRRALTASEQLKRLKEREVAWKTLSPRHGRHFCQWGLGWTLADPVGGSMSSLLDGKGSCLDMEGNMVSHAAFDCCTFPRPWDGSDDTQHTEFTLHGVPVSHVIGFCEDPVQDLLVVLVYGHAKRLSVDRWMFGQDRNSFSLLILSLSKDVQHPHAVAPVVPVTRLQLDADDDFDAVWRETRCAILIRGPLVLIYAREQDGLEDRGLHVLNWRTSFASTIDVFDNGPVIDATFISDHDILVFLPARGVFEVISVAMTGLNDWRPLFCAARFHLPALKHGFHYKHPIKWKSPILCCQGMFVRVRLRGCDGVAVASIRVHEPTRHTTYTYDIVVRPAGLLNIARSLESPCHTRRNFRWDLWGPSLVRIFQRRLYDDITLSVSGYRVACSKPAYDLDHASSNRLSYICVLDFNPRTIARALQDEGESDAVMTTGLNCRSLILDVPPPVGEMRTHIVDDHHIDRSVNCPFNEEVCSCIPYRVTARTYPMCISHVHLDEDHLIAVEETVLNGAMHFILVVTQGGKGTNSVGRNFHQGYRVHVRTDDYSVQFHLGRRSISFFDYVTLTTISCSLGLFRRARFCQHAQEAPARDFAVRSQSLESILGRKGLDGWRGRWMDPLDPYANAIYILVFPNDNSLPPVILAPTAALRHARRVDRVIQIVDKTMRAELFHNHTDVAEAETSGRTVETDVTFPMQARRVESSVASLWGVRMEVVLIAAAVAIASERLALQQREEIDEAFKATAFHTQRFIDGEVSNKRFGSPAASAFSMVATCDSGVECADAGLKMRLGSPASTAVGINFVYLFNTSAVTAEAVLSAENPKKRPRSPISSAAEIAPLAKNLGTPNVAMQSMSTGCATIFATSDAFPRARDQRVASAPYFITSGARWSSCRFSSFRARPESFASLPRPLPASTGGHARTSSADSTPRDTTVVRAWRLLSQQHPGSSFHSGNRYYAVRSGRSSPSQMPPRISPPRGPAIGGIVPPIYAFLYMLSRWLTPYPTRYQFALPWLSDSLAEITNLGAHRVQNTFALLEVEGERKRLPEYMLCDICEATLARVELAELRYKYSEPAPRGTRLDLHSSNAAPANCFGHPDKTKTWTRVWSWPSLVLTLVSSGCGYVAPRASSTTALDISTDAMSFRVNVQKSCSRLFYLVEDDPRLRLGIEKMVCHTTLQSSRRALTASEQLKRLEEREVAWETLSRLHGRRFSLRGMGWTLADPVGGSMSAVIDGDGACLDMEEHTVPHAAFDCCTFPRPWDGLDDTHHTKFTLHGVPVTHVIGFCADPAQDLLVVLVHGDANLLSADRSKFGEERDSFSILFLSLSEDIQHPHAAQPVIPLARLQLNPKHRIDDVWRNQKRKVFIRGPLVAIYGCGYDLLYDRSLHMLNWRTGVVTSIDAFEDGSVNDAAFISDHDILVLLPSRGVLEVFTVANMELNGAYPLYSAARFQLPGLKKGIRYKHPVRFEIGDGVAVACLRASDRKRRYPTKTFDIVNCLILGNCAFRGPIGDHLVHGYSNADPTTLLPFRSDEGKPRSVAVRPANGRSLMADIAPPLGVTRTHIVNETRDEYLDGPFDEVIHSRIPYRVTVRSYAMHFSEVHLDEDHLIAIEDAALGNEGNHLDRGGARISPREMRIRALKRS